jgi:hypothetical protein
LQRSFGKHHLSSNEASLEVIIVWKDTGEHLAKWFSLSSPYQQQLKKLEKIELSS